jgi:hypothetical protein
MRGLEETENRIEAAKLSRKNVNELYLEDVYSESCLAAAEVSECTTWKE